MTRVLVTGIGIISSLGRDVKENHHNLCNRISGIGRSHYFKSKYAEQFLFGEVKASNDDLKELTGLKELKGLTRTDLLAFKAFGEAVTDAGLGENEISSLSTAFISASTVGGMCEHDNLFNDANLRSESSEYLSYYGCAAHTLRIAEQYRIKGYTDTINTACSSSANAIMLGAKLIKAGKAKRVVVGGVDSLAKYTVNGFSALKILSEKATRPFDETRDGLSLGEAAAYLVLEDENEFANKKVYAEVSGYGNSNDAFHSSALSDDAKGVIIAIQKALDSSKLDAGKINYINAHGTGTENNDRVELYGFTKIFEKVPPYSSTKSYTGHTLGAAGAVEAVFSILSIQHQELYPSLNVETPIVQFNIPPVLEYKKDVRIDHVLSNSFGFAGNCTSLIFSKI
jgi:3-oxoacyl-(acyl-carrier-protein) synthase